MNRVITIKCMFCATKQVHFEDEDKEYECLECGRILKDCVDDYRIIDVSEASEK